MEHLLGEIKIWVGEKTPPGFAFCNGDLLMIENNKALFDMIGNKWGGDGKRTFAVPNLNSDEFKYIICIEGIFFI